VYVFPQRFFILSQWFSLAKETKICNYWTKIGLFNELL